MPLLLRGKKKRTFPSRLRYACTCRSEDEKTGIVKACQMNLLSQMRKKNGNSLGHISPFNSSLRFCEPMSPKPE